MRGRLYLSILLVFILTVGLYSQSMPVFFNGKNTEYAGKELEFFYYTERIYDTRKSVSKVIVDNDGNFSISFPLENTQCVYCQTPLYKAFLFAEPGRSYNIELPPLPAGKNNETRNVFFVPPLWHMVPASEITVSKTELNDAIFKFNEQFEPFLDKQILRYYDAERSREKLDSFDLALSDYAGSSGNEYFESYRLYKLATLGFLVNQFNRNDLYEKYLMDKPVRPDVPSWWEFFNLYFDRYISSLTNHPDFAGIYSLIGNGDYSSLNRILKKDPILQNDQIREWVILREFQSAYYESGLPLPTLTALCDSLIFNSSDPITKIISERLKKEASSMLKGLSPPPAKLKSIDGDSLEIPFNGSKYVYIGFCSLNNLECLQEFEYLKYYYHKYSKYLEILVIIPSDEKEKIQSFSDENQIPWKFYYGVNSPALMQDYKIKAFPVFYLVDREGKLIMSPAVLPSDGFEQQLFSILKGNGEI